MTFLRYRRDHAYGQRFPSIRYPARDDVAPERAEQMRQAMPDPDAFEIVDTEE